MKPQIAIAMSRAGIDVMHRASDGWRTVGHVALDAPDFPAQVRSLRDRAQTLVRGSLAAKLIIPDTEILYTTVDAPGPDDEARAAQIAVAVDGMTPYTADELVFDWCGIGDTLQVAVVARETLQEAEAFASEYGIDAVAFVAAPDENRFMGEVYFGRTGMAGWLLPPGEGIERDETSVRSIGPVPAPVPKPALSVPPASAKAAPDVAAGASEGEPKPPRSGPEPETSAPRDPKKLSRKARKEAAARAEAEAKAEREAKAKATAARSDDETGATPPAAVSDAHGPAVAHGPTNAAVGATAPKVSAMAEPPASAAGVAFASRRGVSAPAKAGPAAPDKAELPATAGDAVAPTLLSRFADVRARLGKRLSGGAGSAAEAADSPAKPASDRLGDKARALLSRRAETGATKVPTAVSPPVLPPAPEPRPKPTASDSAPPRARTPSLTGEGAPELKAALAAPVADLSAAGARKAKTADAAGTEAEKLTIFGARGHAPAERGFVSRGLVLTGGLLLFLLAIAVWAVYFTSDPGPRSGVTAPTSTPAPAPQQQAEAPVVPPVSVPEPAVETATDPDQPPFFDEDAQIDATLAGIEEALAEATEPLDTAPEETAAAPLPSEADAASDAGLVVQPAPEGTPGGAATTEPDTSSLRAEAIQTGDEEPIALSALTPPSGTASAMPEPPAAPAPFGTEPVPGAASAPGFEPPPEVIEGRPAVVPPARPQGLVPDDQSGTNLQTPAVGSEAAIDFATATDPAQDGADTVADAIAAVSSAAGALPVDDAEAGPTSGAGAPDVALAEVPDLPLTESEAIGRGLAVFSEAAPQFAAFRPARRPGTVALASPDADASDVAATPAPDAPADASSTSIALADTVAAVASALEAPAAEDVVATRSEAEAAATTQGLSLYSDADPALAGTRPSSRPDAVLTSSAALAAATGVTENDAAPAATPGAIEIAAQAADADSSDEIASRTMTATPGGIVLTALRPAARPETLVAQVPESVADPAPPVVESDNPLAVANSVRPSQRPQDFARRVQQAITAAQAAAPARSAPQQQQQQQPVQQASAPARTAAPQIPTSASVAREATQARAINLRQINLLGTFGTSSSRTALVRLSNGRVEQLRVGDRLDRGQVTAIGESELHYVRSGRTHRLRVAERG